MTPPNDPMTPNDPVIQGGRIVIENGELRRPVDGKTLYVAPEYDRAVESDIAAWFEEAYSVRFRNYAVDESYLSGPGPS